ncbi:uncharacterized protein TNCV_4938621 [Trichonephila clavipes]|nr:uncharacterized protein TNCV_4938621 [Trichonephila clavipes]
MNSSTAFATLWTLSSGTMAAATLDAAIQTEVSSTVLYLRHQDGHTRVWRHRGEHTLTACIRLRHTSPSPSVMVWNAIGYTSRSPPVRIDGTFNSARYISGVL